MNKRSKKSKKAWLQPVLTVSFMVGLTTALYLYTAGYRVQRTENKIDFTKTGMIGAKSIPEGANIYVDGQFRAATNDNVPGLEPGAHSLKIVKNGFITWSKNVEVFPELVTDITAVLISQSPRLEPLTNTGASSPTISPTLSKLAFFSKDAEAPGVWVIPLTEGALSLFRSNPYVVLEDTSINLYSRGQSIEWAPDEDSIMIQDQKGKYHLIDLTKTASNSILIANPEIIRLEWDEELLEKRVDFIEKLDIPEDMQEIAVATDTLWAPDGKKFVYTNDANGIREYHIYNMEKPLPVGESVETVALRTDVLTTQPSITWYSDSFHLVLTEDYNEESGTGKVSLIRIDGTNKTELFNNTLHSERAFSAPGGDKIIILTSFKSAEQADLYTISIR